MPSFFGDAGQQSFDDCERVAVGQCGVGRKKPVKQVDGVDFRFVGDGLCQMSQADQQQENEGNRRQQRVKSQGAGKKRNIVFISGLQGTADEAGG